MALDSSTALRYFLARRGRADHPRVSVRSSPDTRAAR